jgi:hypothetical protein
LPRHRGAAFSLLEEERIGGEAEVIQGIEVAQHRERLNGGGGW